VSQINTPRGKLQPVRSFVAIELPTEVRDWCSEAMKHAQSRLGPVSRQVRWVDSAGLHVTLKFLGTVPTSLIPELTDRLERELAGYKPFRLAIGRLGVFPNPRSPRVLWLALQGDLAALGACQARVEAATNPLGFPPEKRPYQPHLTLGRVRETATPEDLATIGALSTGSSTDQTISFPVDAASLMRSQLGPGGARYTRLAELPFSSYQKPRGTLR
jgi:2'-5' RNA ligase